MKDEAQVSEKFARYDAKLTTRTKIVIGMGLRGFFSLLKLNKKGVWKNSKKIKIIKLRRWRFLKFWILE